MSYKKLFFIVCFAYVSLVLPFIGSVHLFDWDEINFAEAAREMVASGDWFNVTINFEPFWEKPPLFIWLQAICFSVFGVSEFAARFPNALVGLITMLVLYNATETRYGGKAALTAVLLYLGSFTSQLYFKTGIIDPFFNLFIFTSVVFLAKAVECKRSINFLLAGICIGLAILTKGPVVLLLVGLTGLLFQLIYKIHFYRIPDLVILLIGILVLPAIYFGIMINQSGWWFLEEFITYQIELFQEPVASHGQPFYYHAVVLLLGFFPALALCYKALFKTIPFSGDRSLFRFAVILFWVVLVVFSSVTTKIVHYSSMCYLPLALAGGVYLVNGNVKRIGNPVVYFIGLFWVLLLVGFGTLSIDELQIQDKLVDLSNSDVFASSQLQTKVAFSIIPIIILGAFFLGLKIIHTRGKDGRLLWSLALFAVMFHFFMVSSVQPIETVLQQKWVNQLKTYQGKDVAHFTLGFKSYATSYYTQQAKYPELTEAKEVILKRMDKNNFYDLSREDKKYYDAFLRDYVIRETQLPLSLSVRLNRIEDMVHYPELKKVFEGNGYCVYERK